MRFQEGRLPASLEVVPSRGELNAFTGSVRFHKLTLLRAGNRDGEGGAIAADDKRTDRGWTLFGIADQPTWTKESYTLGGRRITLIPDRQKDPDRPQPPRSVFFRRMRDQLETLAGLRASFKARFEKQGDAPACEFELADALLMRRSLHDPPANPGPPRPYNPASLDEPLHTRVTLRGSLSTGHQAIETVYALRNQLRDGVGKLADLALSFQQNLADATVQTIKKDLRDKLLDALKNTDVAKLVFALPVPTMDPLPDLDPDLRAEAQKDLDEAVIFTTHQSDVGIAVGMQTGLLVLELL
jgi:hypothetical protein